MVGHLIIAIPAIVAADPSAQIAPEGVATDWMALLDEQRWSDSWSVAGALLRTHLSSEQWTAAVKSLREPLGALRSRKLRSVTGAQSLPGVPDGEYRIVEFSTNFAKKGEVIETVVLYWDASKWMANGYFIR